MQGTITGNLWLDLALGLIGSGLAAVGMAVLVGLRLPGQDRLPLSGGVLGSVLLAVGLGLVSYFGQPDLADKVVKTLAGS